MAKIGTTSAALRFFGDELSPEEVTMGLGIKPTVSAHKGDLLGSGKRNRRAKVGFWILRTDDREPGNLNAQIQELLSLLSNDLSVWHDFAERFQADLFCGLFLDNGNEGCSLERDTLEAIAQRRLTIEFNIYAPLDE